MSGDGRCARSQVGTDRVELGRLARQWQEIIQQQHGRQTGRRAREVEAWRERFAQMSAQAARLRSRGRWVRGPADLLSVIGRGRDELVHTRLLAWLLDPVGNHGLGAGLLRRLSQHVGVDDLSALDIEEVRIRREVSHPLGRADLIVDLAATTIVVENKIDAPEQPGQCARMVQAFGSDDTRFVFLTLDAAAPTTAGEHADRWVVLSHGQVAVWLAELTEQAGADQVSAARSYLATLTRLTA